jgi:hypothetical protein
MLEAITKQLTDMFPDDPSAPCVTVSLLPNGKFYVSLCRFRERMGQGREVLVKCQRDSLDEALTEVGTAIGVTDAVQ